MHRQSLGSPSSKLHANGLLILKEPSSSSPSSPLKPTKKPNISDEDEKQQKLKKPHYTTPSGGGGGGGAGAGGPHPQKFIHLIPILTLLCIFILYLNSHDPSQIDLAQFNGFKTSSKALDATNIEKIQRVLEIENGEVLAIRSARNLQEVDKEDSRYRIHRKFGDF